MNGTNKNTWVNKKTQFLLVFIRVYSCNSISRITLGILIATVFSCKHQMTPTIGISPMHFKVRTPFIVDGSGIIINTYWGKEKKHHVLCLDNHSPSWIKSSLVQYNQSFIKSEDLGFKTSTADGSSIQGDIGVCDSVFFENIVFKNVPFYIMPDSSKGNRTNDGVLGIDAMSKGVWKIDFKKEELTFASSIDSFIEIRQSEIFPATFNEQSITVDVDLGDNNIKVMAIDMGYNGCLLVPPHDIKKVYSPNRIFLTPSKFSTPSSQNIVNSWSVVDTVKINNNWFFTIISTAEIVKERLIGQAFFKKFDYVIIDFINKRIYIPKKVW